MCRCLGVRSPLASNVWCVSASPISQGKPAFLTLLNGLAPQLRPHEVEADRGAIRAAKT